MLQNKSSLKGYIALFITSIVWGTTWVVSKIGANEIPAFQMAYIRQFIGGMILISFFLLYKKIAFPTSKQFRWLLVMAIIMFVSANGLSTWSIKYIPTGLSALIGALYPLCVVILEKIFFKSKKLTALTFLGLFLGIAGIAVVFYEHAFHEAGPMFLFGVSLSVTAMLSWSIGTIFISRNKVDINPYYGIGWQMLIGSILLFVLAQTTQPVVPIAEISVTVWLVIAYLVFFGSLIAFIAFIYSMKTLSPAIASLYAYVNPLVAMFLAHVVMNEKLSIHTIWGSVITLIGVFLVNYSIRQTAAKAITEPEL